MLQQYKDEVDTLNEALSLAALEVVAAGYEDVPVTRKSEDGQSLYAGEDLEEKRKNVIVVNEDGTFQEQSSTAYGDKLFG